MENIVVSLIVGILGAFITSVGLFLTTKFNYRDLYSKSVSSSRMDWINNFREEISTIIAALKMSIDEEDLTDAGAKYLFEAEKARAKLLTRLNMDTSRIGNEYNEAMATLLNEIDFKSSCATHEDRTDVLIDLTRKILEPEWVRVKQEAGGKRFETM